MAITVTNRTDLWLIANALMPNAIKNEFESERAGYPVYRDNSRGYICDLNDRLELNFLDGSSKNIWLSESCFSI